MDERVPYVQVCTECDVKNKPITDKSDINVIERGGKGVSAIDWKERKMKRGEVRAVDEFPFDLTKDAYCWVGKMYAEMSGSEFQVDQRELILQT